MVVTVVPNSLWELQVGDEAVVRDTHGWTPRYSLTQVVKSNRQSLTITSGAVYMKATGKIHGRYPTPYDRLFAPHELVEFNGVTVTAREAVDFYRTKEEEMSLKSEYTKFIIEQGYNKLIRMEVATLKQVAELLGYKSVGGAE
jgi:hypothetical protein